jgi:aminoglycoside phosphotransferase (APT) family kinase protein
LVPIPAWAQTDDALASTAALLRRFHDSTVGFVAPEEATWSEELADLGGAAEVICHNDVCPENVVFRDGLAVALLDFEFAAPGRRAFDVAAMARMCVPIEMEADAARTGRGGLDPVARLAVVADAYGLDHDQRTELVGALAAQIDTAGEFVRRRVERGEPAFIEMWDAFGGQERYDRRRAWFAVERSRFLAGLRVGV